MSTGRMLHAWALVWCSGVAMVMGGCATTPSSSASDSREAAGIAETAEAPGECGVRLELHGGDTLTGVMKTNQFEVRSAIGDFRLPIESIYSISFNVSDDENQDRVSFWGRDQSKQTGPRPRQPGTDLITGHVQPETITVYNQAAGRDFSFTQDQIKRLFIFGCD